MFSDFECSTSYNHKATWVKHQVVKPGRMRAQKERVKVTTIDQNNSCDTAPKGLKKWLILSIKLN
ncbi:hypothetical protein HanXRQr2_Chr02g0086201 [Helianthus annuus]|uniref:Uncharacterized protein n=1 Tax=Helianthus annuus TaxID=4232 RepID=A0A251VL23_HELAN|nr:hypothetical protein HanXRQr2_Chr02g0086201 [Helianthus annuus]